MPVEQCLRGIGHGGDTLLCGLDERPKIGGEARFICNGRRLRLSGLRSPDLPGWLRRGEAEFFGCGLGLLHRWNPNLRLPNKPCA